MHGPQYQKRGLEIKKGSVKVSVLAELVCLLNDGRKSRDLVCCGVIWRETHLLEVFSKSYRQKSLGEKFPGENLSRNESVMPL